MLGIIPAYSRLCVFVCCGVCCLFVFVVCFLLLFCFFVCFLFVLVVFLFFFGGGGGIRKKKEGEKYVPCGQPQLHLQLCVYKRFRRFVIHFTLLKYHHRNVTNDESEPWVWYRWELPTSLSQEPLVVTVFV